MAFVLGRRLRFGNDMPISQVRAIEYAPFQGIVSPRTAPGLMRPPFVPTSTNPTIGKNDSIEAVSRSSLHVEIRAPDFVDTILIFDRSELECEAIS